VKNKYYGKIQKKFKNSKNLKINLISIKNRLAKFVKISKKLQNDFIKKCKKTIEKYKK
jgi:hypothetical protein